MNQATVDINNSDEDNNANGANSEEGIPVLKITSYKEAVANLEDALQFLQSKGDIITANELSKVIFRTQND